VAVTIRVHAGEVGRGLAAKVLEDAGFTVEDYLRS
jgi:hypothetical protein